MRQFFKKQWKHNKQLVCVCVTAFAFIAAFVQMAAGLTYVLRLTPILLTVIACTAVIFWDGQVGQKLRASAIIVIGSFIVEVIGVKTGFIFGDYTYGSLMGFRVLGVPITIGITWLLVSLSAWHIVMLNLKSLWQKFVLAGVLVVMFDLILEQFAVAYGLWSWQGGIIPLYNYICWFMVSLVWFFVLHTFTPKAQPSIYAISILPLMGAFFWLMLVIA